jgi:hypothetical protein
MGVSPSIYKKFYYERYTYMYDDYDLIIENLVKLNKIINEVNRYKNNIKPKELPVRKLSIFK